ncbi:MAG: suppressor of fused domain protein, partial [Vicingaceae bacterium]
MGLFDIFKGKTKELTDETSESAVGWDAIEDELQKVYGDQKPMHFAPEINYNFGGEDPLDGLSIYYNESTKHYHYVTYGLTELYN